MKINISLKFPGLLLLLTTIFIVLKILNVISWSWLWVFSPLWIGFGTFIIIFAIVLFAAIISER